MRWQACPSVSRGIQSFDESIEKNGLRGVNFGACRFFRKVASAIHFGEFSRFSGLRRPLDLESITSKLSISNIALETPSQNPLS